MKKRRIAVKMTVFLLLTVMLFWGLTYALRPTWAYINNYNTTHGFYEEPHDTIETLFLGSSVTVESIIPMELYENYGICAYNMATESQPMMASYYWLQEVERLHGDTLDTVVLDLSILQRSTGTAGYVKSLDGMRLSLPKLHYLKDYSKKANKFFTYLIPILAFHDSWKEWTAEDFDKFGATPATYTRGYFYRMETVLDDITDFHDVDMPKYVLLDDSTKSFNEGQQEYLMRIIEYCDKNDLRLIFMKSPQRGTNSWNDAAHNTAQAIADEYGVEFIDFNYLPYFDDLGFNFATETADNKHMNYYGATKYTDWWGQYLSEECGNTDVRGDEKYSFMEDELVEYHRSVAQSILNEFTDPVEYLSYLEEQGDYTVFITVQDDAANALTDEQREAFASLGLTQLSELTYRSSYLAVIENGQVMEMSDENEEPEIPEGTDDEIEAYNTDWEKAHPAISYEGQMDDGTRYILTSGGYNLGNISSILIEGEEYSTNSSGLHFTVYDNKLGQFVDSSVFNTGSSANRTVKNYEEALENALERDGTAAGLTGKLKQLYLYNRQCDDWRTARLIQAEQGDAGLLYYLQAFMGDENFDIYIAVRGDAASALTDEVRAALADMGLTELAKLQPGDSYVGQVENGEISVEKVGEGGEKVTERAELYSLISACGDYGDKGSIKVDGKQYAGGTQGISVAVYDNILNMVFDSKTYDTGNVIQSVPEQ